MEWYEALISLFGILTGLWIWGKMKAFVIARKLCIVCGYRVGYENRVSTNGDWYHFKCWCKVAREKVFGDKNLDKIQ